MVVMAYEIHKLTNNGESLAHEITMMVIRRMTQTDSAVDIDHIFLNDIHDEEASGAIPVVRLDRIHNGYMCR
jgi:hypothetical protein